MHSCKYLVAILISFLRSFSFSLLSPSLLTNSQLYYATVHYYTNSKLTRSYNKYIVCAFSDSFPSCRSTKLTRPAVYFQPALNQCRLRRIQSREDSFRTTCPSATDTATPLPDSDSRLASGASPRPDSSTHLTTTSPPTSPPPSPPTYPFPPPGLSKPSTPTSTRANDMVTPEFEPLPYTSSPSELDFKSGPLPSLPQQTEPDGSIWNSFQMESFLGNYCHTTGKSVPSSTHHGDSGDGTGSYSSNCSGPPSLSPTHWNRLKNPSIALQTALKPLTLSMAAPSPQPSLLPLPPPPLSSLSSPPHINLFVVHRQQQQAFMTRWNRVREKDRYAPVMPSFFNPVRKEAPDCTWTFLRDPVCGGAVNERASARRGRESIFEKALVKLPLTRCRRCVSLLCSFFRLG